MKKFLSLVLFISLFARVQAQDPNFYIYLCFGQSNMEGNATPEAVDKVNLDSRFQMMAATDFSNLNRTMGNWYTAYPPIVNPGSGLSVVDYFGRTMVAVLPHNIKVGIINVSIGGCGIDMFDKDNYQSQLTDPTQWSAILANKYFGGNPYGRLIEMAKKAQQAGVIKGILLHQGESNNMQESWLQKVKKIYGDMLTDLNLKADDTPLFAGELVDAQAGGACSGMNPIIDRLPTVVPTAHVIHSNGCPCKDDHLHFTASSYRIMGKRYALEVLRTLNVIPKVNTENTVSKEMTNFLTAQSMTVPDKLMLKVGYGSPISIKASFADGHQEDISREATFDIPTEAPAKIEDGQLSSSDEFVQTVHADYSDLLGNSFSSPVNIEVRYFPFDEDNVSKVWDTFAYDEAARSFTIAQYGQAGWVYPNGVDMSKYKYMVVKLKEVQTCGAQIRIFNQSSIWGASEYIKDINDATTVVIPLQSIKRQNGAAVDLSHIYIVDFWCNGGTIKVDDVYLTNNADYTSGIAIPDSDNQTVCQRIYTLNGQYMGSYPASSLRRTLSKGVYLCNGKKVIIDR